MVGAIHAPYPILLRVSVSSEQQLSVRRHAWIIVWHTPRSDNGSIRLFAFWAGRTPQMMLIEEHQLQAIAEVASPYSATMRTVQYLTIRQGEVSDAQQKYGTPRPGLLKRMSTGASAKFGI